ncbi:hypothetical protein Tco_1044348 [Tanacetum coccineum]|uniref:Copia protein n=1 Tax=Tanacetum coccineum TaxID=301880 RepID=A0ABQ5GPN8_9ASTR
MKVEESLNVTFDETPPLSKTSLLEDDDLVEEEAIKVNETRPLGNDVEDNFLENNEIINIKESKCHPTKNWHLALGILFSKKQTDLAISTTEAKYVSVGKAFQLELWMKQALVDYGIRLDDIPMMRDNKGALD